MVVYDIESRTPILKLENHDDDVNAVCFGDKSSPHILYSGSDDTTIKVWDRRSMGDGRAAGCFLGHSEGISEWKRSSHPYTIKSTMATQTYVCEINI